MMDHPEGVRKLSFPVKRDFHKRRKPRRHEASGASRRRATLGPGRGAGGRSREEKPGCIGPDKEPLSSPGKTRFPNPSPSPRRGC